jgi:hypothetical protein
MINIKQELEVAKKASEIAAVLLFNNKDNINKILSNEGRDVKLKAVPKILIGTRFLS